MTQNHIIHNYAPIIETLLDHTAWIIRFGTADMSELSTAARHIQRNFRGWKGRKAASCLRREREEMFQAYILSYYTTVIQRHVRGWISRKHLLNHRRRSKFLSEVARANDLTRRNLLMQGQANIDRYQLQARSSADKRRVSLAKNQHHLVSTKTIPGVFSPPHTGPIVTPSGTPMESLIKSQTLPGLRVDKHMHPK